MRVKARKNAVGGWTCVIDIDPGEDGRRRRKSFSAATKREAEKRAELWLKQERERVERLSQPISLGEYLYAWLQTRKPDLAPNTWRQYDQHIRLYVLPTLGNVRLHELTAMQVRAALAEMKTSQRTRHHTLMTLNVALRAAEEDRLIGVNPCKAVKVAKGRPKTVSLTSEEAARLLAACEAEGSDYADVVALALLTGMRHGEVLGLEWGDVTWSRAFAHPGDGLLAPNPQSASQPSRWESSPSAGASPASIHVSRALQHVTGQGMVERPPKTEAGERAIPLGPQAVALLERRRKQHEKVVSIGVVAVPASGPDVSQFARASSRRGVDLGALIFPQVKPTALRRRFKILLRRAECPDVPFHALRHTYATQLRPYLDTRGIADLLGHADPAVTARMYMHRVERLDAAAVLAYESLLKAPALTDDGKIKEA